MAVKYDKLWDILADRKMKKKELVELSGISKSTITKMTHDEHVSTEMLAKICTALQVDLSDIVEVIPDNPRGEANE